MQKEFGSFEWDPRKERINIRKHGVNFTLATKAFKDPNRKLFVDSRHSEKEERFFCIGKVGDKIVTVRFIYRSYRSGKVRIIGAGYWRKGRKYYEKK